MVFASRTPVFSRNITEEMDVVPISRPNVFINSPPGSNSITIIIVFWMWGVKRIDKRNRKPYNDDKRTRRSSA